MRDRRSLFWEAKEMYGLNICLHQLKWNIMVLPRLSALSEVLWSPKENKDWPPFQTKIETMKKRYDMWGASYFKGKE